MFSNCIGRFENRYGEMRYILFLSFLAISFGACKKYPDYVNTINEYQDTSLTSPPQDLLMAIRIATDNKDVRTLPIIFKILSNSKPSNHFDQDLFYEILHAPNQISSRQWAPYLLRIIYEGPEYLRILAVSDFMNENNLPFADNVYNIYLKEKDPSKKFLLKMMSIYFGKNRIDNIIIKEIEIAWKDEKFQDLIIKLMQTDNIQQFEGVLQMCLDNGPSWLKQGCIGKIISSKNMRYQEILVEQLLNSQDENTLQMILKSWKTYPSIKEQCPKFINRNSIILEKIAIECVGK